MLARRYRPCYRAAMTTQHIEEVRAYQSYGVITRAAGRALADSTRYAAAPTVDARLMFIHGWRTGHQPPCTCPVYFNGDNANPC